MEIEIRPSETIIILGAPGSGKDTQSEFLKESLGYQIISTGDLCRMLAGHNEQVKKSMERGELVPDSIVEDELISTFALLPDEQPVILDGYPRNIEQAKKLGKILEEYNRKLDRVLYITLPVEEAVKRLGKRRICSACGKITVKGNKDICEYCGGSLIQRKDDNEVSVKKRMKIFEENIKPLIEYFREIGILREVDGTPSPEVVREEIKAVL